MYLMWKVTERLGRLGAGVTSTCGRIREFLLARFKRALQGGAHVVTNEDYVEHGRALIVGITQAYAKFLAATVDKTYL